MLEAELPSFALAVDGVGLGVQGQGVREEAWGAQFCTSDSVLCPQFPICDMRPLSWGQTSVTPVFRVSVHFDQWNWWFGAKILVKTMQEGPGRALCSILGEHLGVGIHQ